MAMITVQVWDATGNKRQEVELPDDAPVNRILAVLLDKMNLPQTAPDGNPVYRDGHVVEIQLTKEYPRQSPTVQDDHAHLSSQHRTGRHLRRRSLDVRRAMDRSGHPHRRVDHVPGLQHQESSGR